MKKSTLWKALGPGILTACAAVGGSHLVWSTQAGAIYGWGLLWLVLIALLVKFPFFLYGQRYTAATGESLLAGYQRQGIAYVWIFLGINVLTGMINIAGVAMLTGALFAGYQPPLGLDVPGLTVLLITVCALLLLLGHYRLLDGLAKVIMVILSISTLVAVCLALPNRPEIPADFSAPNPYQWVSFAFLISLLGWMPCPIDLSAWSSLWIFSRQKQTGHLATVRETSIDFYIGYAAATFLAVLFIALGALVMFGTGEEFVGGGISFSQQLVNLYTATIGDWSRWLILSAAFMTMFSTTLTCLDGYPRSLAACCALIRDLDAETFQKIHRALIIVSAVSASVIVLTLVQNLLQLLSFAAIVSFLTSPVLAWINLKVMRGQNVPESERPGPVLMVLSWLGLAFFVVMSLGYLIAQFGLST